MLVGYARVSTEDQSLEGQHDALVAAGCDAERVYTDVASGSRTARPGLDQALAALREGDVLVVQRLDRVGRSVPHLIGLVAELEGRGVGLRVLDRDIDTSTASGKLVFHLFAALAEFERELIRERTRVGLAAARARGRKGGRPSKMNPPKLRRAMELMANRETVAKDVAAELGVSTSTLYRFVDGKGNPKAKARELLGMPPVLSEDDELPPEPGEDESGSEPEPGAELEALASLVLEAGEAVQGDGRWDNRVFIRPLWVELRGRSGAPESLEAFKELLYQAHQAGLLVLARADMAHLEPTLAEASEIVRLDGQVRFHLVELPQPEPSGELPPVPPPAEPPVPLYVEQAAQVMDAARALVAEGLGVGEHHVWICDVVSRSGVSKDELLKLHNAEELWLEGVVEPEGLSADKFGASIIKHHGHTMVFVRVEPA